MTPDWISQMKIFFDDYTHRQPYTVTAVKDILNIFGFREVNSEIFYQLPNFVETSNVKDFKSYFKSIYTGNNNVSSQVYPMVC